MRKAEQRLETILKKLLRFAKINPFLLKFLQTIIKCLAKHLKLILGVKMFSKYGINSKGILRKVINKLNKRKIKLNILHICPAQLKEFK